MLLRKACFRYLSFTQKKVFFWIFLNTFLIKYSLSVAFRSSIKTFSPFYYSIITFYKSSHDMREFCSDENFFMWQNPRIIQFIFLYEYSVSTFHYNFFQSRFFIYQTKCDTYGTAALLIRQIMIDRICGKYLNILLLLFFVLIKYTVCLMDIW